MRTRVAAGGCAARYAVGVHPYVLPKLVVNDPTLLKPTVKQMSATLRSVERKSEAARSRRHRHIERIAVARVNQVFRAQQMPGSGDGRHLATSIPIHDQ
jgi:hypothetical protein